MVNSGVDISDIYENASEHYATIDQEFVIFNIRIELKSEVYCHKTIRLEIQQNEDKQTKIFNI